ncbi:MAG TPA: transglycosylase SLT domain-containing protein [Blastocatellia bacterium]|jgi:membrane-bound lytic murein transglycosylase D
MRLTSKVGRANIVSLLSLSIIAFVAPAKSLAQDQQSQQHAQPVSTAQPGAVSDPQSIITRAEEAFARGEEAWGKGLPDVARKLFDQAVDIILESGIDLARNEKLNAFYRKLVDRIHQVEVRPAVKLTPKPIAQDAQEPLEPAPIDELSDVKDEELATVTSDGIKIFGKYDYEFSVAPPVLQYINFFVTGRGRSTMETGLQRSGRYRSMAEKIFKEERVPIDLIWLAQAESVWKPNALSRAAAKGIWQFIPGTGTRFGLAQTQWIDDRSHPEKSTRAAARYLRFLHEFFAGDWLLAMAAYNSGEYRVAGAISKCGYADFWELYRRGLLPSETRNYVPIILAITIISKNQKRYGFNVTPDPPLNYETYELPSQTDLKVVADLLQVPFEVVQDLNPELRRGTSPPGQRYGLKLPKGLKKQFEIAYASMPEDQRTRKISIPAEEVAQSYRPAYRTQQASYRVRSGDTMSSLARKHGVSVEELARANRLSSRGKLRKGQTIKIPKSAQAKSSVKSGKAGRYKSKEVTRSRVSKGSKTASLKSKPKAKPSKKQSSRRRR